MTRQDYILHLDKLRSRVLEIIEFDLSEKKIAGELAGPTSLELERSKKTQKMLHGLVQRLYEDAGISMKVKQDKILCGELDQAEISFWAEYKAETPEEKGGAE